MMIVRQRASRRTRIRAQSTGFTIAELLVCIGVIGVLAALVLPAVQSSRESAGRLQCKNNLRQIGIGLQAFEGAHQMFPRGGDMVLDGTGGQWPRSHSPHLYLLPYLEWTVIYSRVDLLHMAERSLSIAPGVNDANDPVKRLSLPVFLCPSDGGAWVERRNNYRANIGVTAFPRFANVPPDPPLPGDGAFFPVAAVVRPQSFVDGLSNTVGFSEKLGGDGDPSHYSPARDYFFLHDVVDPKTVWDSPAFNALHVQACASLANPNPPHDSTPGEFWFYAGLPDTWYGHLLTPNHPIPDCGELSGMFGSGVMTARSLHPGGVNCLMMDGAVRFVTNGVDLDVWQAVGTRNGRVPASLE